jgi:hypothetical protein
MDGPGGDGPVLGLPVGAAIGGVVFLLVLVCLGFGCSVAAKPALTGAHTRLTCSSPILGMSPAGLPRLTTIYGQEEAGTWWPQIRLVGGRVKGRCSCKDWRNRNLDCHWNCNSTGGDTCYVYPGMSCNTFDSAGKLLKASSRWGAGDGDGHGKVINLGVDPQDLWLHQLYHGRARHQRP